MDYKKKYEEALERAKDNYKAADSAAINVNSFKNTLIAIFPELKESKDEKIRKAIYNALKYLESEQSWDFLDDVDILDAYAWLEKQSETRLLKTIAFSILNHLNNRLLARTSLILSNEECESFENDFVNAEWGKVLDFIEKKLVSHEMYKIKPQGKSALEAIKEEKADNANKVEPKFRVGDWVVFENKHQSTYQVEKIEDGYYILRHTHGGTFRICVLHDGSLRLWTFQDAEDGDVLVASDCSIFLFKGIDYCSCKHYVALTTNNVVIFNENFVHYWETSTAVHPATKEQRELLFAKMKEDGYKWDANNKQLIKL